MANDCADENALHLSSTDGSEPRLLCEKDHPNHRETHRYHLDISELCNHTAGWAEGTYSSMKRDQDPRRIRALHRMGRGKTCSGLIARRKHLVGAVGVVGAAPFAGRHSGELG